MISIIWLLARYYFMSNRNTACNQQLYIDSTVEFSILAHHTHEATLACECCQFAYISYNQNLTKIADNLTCGRSEFKRRLKPENPFLKSCQYIERKWLLS